MAVIAARRPEVIEVVDLIGGRMQNFTTRSRQRRNHHRDARLHACGLRADQQLAAAWIAGAVFAPSGAPQRPARLAKAL
jgi:hypothetical protein